MARRLTVPGRSCLECRRRKIKCDRSLPCTYCTRTKLQCAYPSRRPNTNAAVESDLVLRVQSIESALQSLEQKVAQIGSFLQVEKELPSRPNRSTQERQSSIDAVHDLPNLTLRSQHNAVTTQSTNSHLLQSLPFNNFVDAPQSLNSILPSPSNISFMWQTYLDAVDPLLKIFHIPSTQRHVMNMSKGREADAPMECLMFVIFYSAVISLSAAECLDELDEERPVLLQRYREGVESTLIRANFLSSQNITVLQAFVIYLVSGRQDENGPNVCALVGLAIGNAMKLGLHIEIPGMNTFELEMRRRLWWQIRTLDVQIARDFGGEPFIIDSSLSSKLPLNVNDISLDPDMGELPNPQPGRSEMLFSLVRFEVSNFARRILFTDQFHRNNSYQIMNEAEKSQAVDQFTERIEKQYLSYCYEAVPLDGITILSSRLSLARLKLAVCKPCAQQNHGLPLRTSYRKACENVLQHAHALRQYSKGRRWLWLLQPYIEWDPLAYLLLDICITLSSPPSPSEPITVPWRVVDESYNHWKRSSDVHQDRRWVNIEELYSQALSVREKTQQTVKTIQESPYSQQAHGQSDDVSESPIETQHQYESSPESVHNQHATTVTTTDSRFVLISPNSRSCNVQVQCPYVTDVQGSESKILADQTPLMGILANAATAWAEEQVSVNTADLPGSGTVCEWSASLIERYWEVAGQGHGDPSVWHPS